MKKYITITSLIFLNLNNYSFADTLKLPTDEEINKIVKMCGMGSSNSTEAEAEAKYALKAWKSEVKAAGKFKKDELSGLLEKAGQSLKDVAPLYYQCLDKRLNAVVGETIQESGRVEETVKSEKEGQASITFKNPECKTIDNRPICYVTAISQNKDIDFCINKGRILIDGENIAIGNSGTYISGVIYTMNSKNETRLLEGTPEKVGVWGNDENLLQKAEKIDLLSIQTCEGKTINIKNFAPSGKSDYVYVIE